MTIFHSYLYVLPEGIHNYPISVSIYPNFWLFPNLEIDQWLWFTGTQAVKKQKEAEGEVLEEGQPSGE